MAKLEIAVEVADDNILGKVAKVEETRRAFNNAWDTYQGTLDSECGLHGDWKYEIMGKELVLTGARLIGQVPKGE